MHAPCIEDGVGHLARRDRVLAEIIRRVGPCTLKRSNNYFVTLAEAIIWQQLSWKAAKAIHERWLAALGARRPRPADVLAASSAELAGTGLSRQKIRYLRELATRFERNRFPRRIRRLSDEQVIERLTEIRGIGRWSAEMFLIFGLNRPDVFPAGDLSLRKAIGRSYACPDTPTPAEIAPIVDLWKPYRTVASWYLWASIDAAPFETRARDRTDGR